MARRQASRRIAGALLFACIVAVAAGIFMLDELVEATRGRTEIVAVVSEAGGVRRGTPVWIAGKPAGQVKQVEFLPRRADGPRLAITLEIVGRDGDQVRAASTARVTTEGLVGGAVVDIIPAPATNRPLGDNDTIYGRPTGSTDDVRAGAASLSEAIDSLTGAAASLAVPVRRFALRADHVQRNVAAVRAELAAVERMLEPGADGRIFLDSAFLAKLDGLMTTARELGIVFRRARTRYANAPSELGAPLARVQQRADSLSARIASFRSLIASREVPGAPARMRADSAIFVAIRGVQAQLDSLIAEVRRDPFKFAF